MKMWAKLRSRKIAKDGKESTAVCRSISVTEEYLNAFRTESYVELFTKAQSIVNEPFSSSYFDSHIFDILLEPRNDTISNILESAIFSKRSELKGLLLNYFNISAEASRICSHLLRSVGQIQSNYQFIQRVLEVIGDYSPEEFEYAISELDSFNLLNNPFSNPSQNDFKQMHNQYSSTLHHLNSKKKKVARKIKLIKYFNKASKICLTATCGVVVAAAIILSIHTLSGILLGPMIFGFSPLRLKKKFINFQFLRSGILKKLGEQIDLAAKGTYILNRDFDTMSRLVVRLHDEIEHNKAMIRFCLERREDKFPFQEVVKELRKSDDNFRRQVKELEEHVYLCLVTINKARVSVIKEILATCASSIK